MSRILIVAAHPDDEVLGVGATAARHASAGDDVHVLILAEGATSRNARADAELVALREAGSAAAAILGTRTPIFAGFPDNRMDGPDLLDVVKHVEQVVSDVRPEVVYTHHDGDLNVDHRVCHAAVLTACRPLPGGSVDRILTFETVSSTEWGSSFHPTEFVNVEATLERKMAALDCYHMEMRPFPHARSHEAVRALAAVRGAQAGLTAAEAFTTIRTLWR